MNKKAVVIIAAIRLAIMFAFAVACSFIFAAAVAAQQIPTCAPHDAQAAMLAAGFGEPRPALGLAANGAVLETWANLETGSWTVTMTAPGGLTCMVAAGTNWQAMAEKPIAGELN